MRRRKRVLVLDSHDIGILLELVAEHVRPEQYKEGSNVRDLIVDAKRLSDEDVFTHYRIEP